VAMIIPVNTISLDGFFILNDLYYNNLKWYRFKVSIPEKNIYKEKESEGI